MGEMMRASDAERHATAERLGEAVAEGRLTLEEFTERVDAALTATYRDQLADLIADLPTSRTPATTSSSSPASVRPTTPARPTVLTPARTGSVFGDLKRRGAWLLPQTSTWHTVFGDVKLDLRQASLDAAEVTIDATTVFGDVEVLVPPGVLVDLRSRAVFGDVRQLTEHPPTPGAPTIIVTGHCLFGDVTVRDVARREKIWRWLTGGGGPEGRGPEALR